MIYNTYMLGLFLAERRGYGGEQITELDVVMIKAELTRRRVLKALLG